MYWVRYTGYKHAPLPISNWSTVTLKAIMQDGISLASAEKMVGSLRHEAEAPVQPYP